MKSHKFDIEDAEKYGVNKAIILEHLKFHQAANADNPDMVFDGKPHAFLAPETIKKMYPYFNARSIRRWLAELEDEGVIEARKPHTNEGHHLKYYHVAETGKSMKILNGQNDQSNGQNDRSMNGQNDRSSIYNQCEVPMEGRTFSEKVENCKSKPELLTLWKEYRRSKGKHMNLYELDVMLNRTFKAMSIPQIKEAILYTVSGGWMSLQIPESAAEEEDNRHRPNYL